MFDLCACGCPLPADPRISLRDSGGAWWRMACAARAGYLLRDLQNLPPSALGLIVSVLRDNGRDALANMIVGSIPFDQEGL